MAHSEPDMTAVGALRLEVQDVLDELVGTGAETGVQVAVRRHGALVVDAVAGVADSRSGREVTARTPFFSFSAGKVMTSLIAHLLVDTGALGYDTPLVDLWPEFGAHGKEGATLRHVLTHSVGVPAMPRTIGPDALADRPRVCRALADAEPRWRPGTETGYHAYTFGFLVGEVARRATGRTMRQLLREWVTAPLGLDGELYFGVPRADLHRLAHLEDSLPPPAPDPDAVLAPWERGPSADLGNSPAILLADVPSVGTFTARAVTAVHAALLDGRLIGPDRLAEVTAPAFEGTDQVFGHHVRLALGYPLGGLGARKGTEDTTFGWAGGGGSHVCADTATGVSFALTKNRLTPDFDAARRLTELVMTRLADD